MERAARVLGHLSIADEEKLAQAAWPAAVGKRIAARTGAVQLVGRRLVVGVEDAVWQRQLWTLRGQILLRIEEVVGRKIVEELEFRVVTPRPGAGREERSAASRDEADTIMNPVLRRIYRASRKRASA